MGGEEGGAQGCDVLQKSEVSNAFPSLYSAGDGVWGWCPQLIQSGRLGQLLLPPLQTLKDIRDVSASSLRRMFWQLLGLKALRVPFSTLDCKEL